MTRVQLYAPLARLWLGVEHAMQAMAARRELSRMDDRMLQDLGVSRAQAEFQATHWHDREHH